MWIRSQNKKQLYKSFGFEIVNGDVYCLFGTTVSKIGSYSTKEKALKVLDMIQETINGKKKSYYTTSGYGKALVKNEYYENTSNIVFQMPADEEV